MKPKDWNDRKQVIEYWQEKDKEWLISQMWNNRQLKRNFEQKYKKEAEENRKLRSALWDSKKLIDKLSKIIDCNKIEQRTLLIIYSKRECKHPQSNNIDFECEDSWYNDCQGCKYEHFKELTKKMSLLFFEIIDDTLYGINKKLEDVTIHNCEKIIDTTTNTILYKEDSECE